MFDERDLAEISAPEQFPRERLIVCRNPLLAQERARKREALLTATERDLARIAARVQAKRSPLRGAAEIGRAVGAVVGKHKVAKHFEIEIGEAQLAYRRKPDAIAREARLDGVYVVRTSVPAAALDADETVQAYKDLARVEQVFRTMKSQGFDLEQSQIETPQVMAKLILAVLIAALRTMQLVYARSGTTGQKLSDAMDETAEPLVEALTAKLEGKTAKLKNPHARGTLARLSWVVGRLGGWARIRRPWLQARRADNHGSRPRPLRRHPGGLGDAQREV